MINEKPARDDAATPPGSNSNDDVTGDVAALNPRLIAATPAGVELMGERPRCAVELKLIFSQFAKWGKLSNLMVSGRHPSSRLSSSFCCTSFCCTMKP